MMDRRIAMLPLLALAGTSLSGCVAAAGSNRRRFLRAICSAWSWRAAGSRCRRFQLLMACGEVENARAAARVPPMAARNWSRFMVRHGYYTPRV